MSAVALLLNPHEVGASVWADGDELVVRAPDGILSPLLVRELRDHKPVVIEVLTGRRCRHCEGALDWTRPGWVPFADGTAAHLGCYEEAEVARLLAAAKRSLFSPDALADPGEVLLHGGIK